MPLGRDGTEYVRMDYILVNPKTELRIIFNIDPDS